MNSNLFVILGAEGSGRAALLGSLIEADSRVLVHVEEKESILKAKGLEESLIPWKWIDGRIAIGGDIPPSSELFFLTHGRQSPVDQVEGIRDWMDHKPVELARILTVVNCRLLLENEKLRGWYDACIHFSDGVLLGGRQDVPNRWIDDFIESHQKQNYPCLFRYVKKDRIDRPAEVLIPEARRISLAFEDPEDAWDEQGNRIEEPYFVRDAAGRRTKWVPEITDFLESGNRQSAIGN